MYSNIAVYTPFPSCSAQTFSVILLPSLWEDGAGSFQEVCSVDILQFFNTLTWYAYIISSDSQFHILFVFLYTFTIP